MDWLLLEKESFISLRFFVPEDCDLRKKALVVLCTLS